MDAHPPLVFFAGCARITAVVVAVVVAVEVAVVVAVVAVGDREVTEDVEAEDKVLCRE